MKTGIITTNTYLNHDTGYGHPERADRVTVVIDHLKKLTLEINDYLVDLFLKADLILVDFKLEFGKNSEKIYLGDEFTPDGCRIWDKETKKKLDKDRFRQDLGDVVESYQEIAYRIGVDLK